jgi:hypothetical protein
MHWINLFYKTYSFGKDKRLTPGRQDIADISLKDHFPSDQYVEGSVSECIIGNSALRDAPNPSARRTTELLFGEHFNILEEKDGWAWGQAQYDKYVGYIPAIALKPISHNVHARVSSPLTWAYSEADLKSHPIRGLSMGACLPEPKEEKLNGFCHFPDIGWVWNKYVTPLNKNLDFMILAEKFLDAPYLWGGKTALGIDCSGLTQITLGLAGVPLPRDTDQQELALGHEFNLPDWQDTGALTRGDMVFFPGHVGLMVDDKNIIHANATHMATTINPLKEVIDIVARQNKTPVTSVKRITKILT